MDATPGKGKKQPEKQRKQKENEKKAAVIRVALGRERKLANAGPIHGISMTISQQAIATMRCMPSVVPWSMRRCQAWNDRVYL